MKDRIAQELGKRGGQATASRHGKAHFSEAGKKGMAKRWGVRKDLKTSTPQVSEKVKSNPRLTENGREPDA